MQDAFFSLANSDNFITCSLITGLCYFLGARIASKKLPNQSSSGMRMFYSKRGKIPFRHRPDCFLIGINTENSICQQSSCYIAFMAFAMQPLRSYEKLVLFTLAGPHKYENISVILEISIPVHFCAFHCYA